MHLTDLQIARVAHEANRAYCTTQGDHSPPSWIDSPDWQIESAVAGVSFVRANPAITPMDVHANWLTAKLSAGWAYGARDTTLKTHPCCVPWSELPKAERRKDVLFLAVVRALLREEV